MPCVHEFGMIMNFDKNKDYGYYHPKEYNCVTIDDDAINDWWESIIEMKSHYHCFNRPETGLARYGVTLIPPESLDLFYDIVANNTNSEFIDETPPLLEIILKAKANNKFIIHFGV